MVNWLHPFRFRQKLWVQSSLVDASLTNFPAAIFTDKVTSDYPKKMAVTRSNGTSQLYVEIDQSTSKGSILHVKIPSVSSVEDTIIYLYFDPAVEDNDQYVGIVGSTPGKTVWDTNFKAVYHMDDNPDSTHIKDSTSNGNNGTKTGVGANKPVEVSDKIGVAQEFEDNFFTIITLDNAISFAGEFTVEFLVYRYNNTQQHMLLGAIATNNYVAAKAIADFLEIQVLNGGALDDTVALSTAEWVKVAITRNSADKIDVYVDDGAANRIYGDAAQNGNSDWKKISSFSGALGVELEGKLDEIRFSDTKRSDAWIKASDYSDINGLLAYGNVENREVGTKIKFAPQPPIPLNVICDAKRFLEAKTRE